MESCFVFKKQAIDKEKWGRRVKVTHWSPQTLAIQFICEPLGVTELNNQMGVHS